MKLFGTEEQQAVEDTLEEVEQPLEMARDISRHAYPIVLGAGVLICAFLFLLL